MGSKRLLTLFLLVFVVCLANCQERIGGGSTLEKLSKIYKFFGDRKICREEYGKRQTYTDYYTLITFKCDWIAFVDAVNNPDREALAADDNDATTSRRRGPPKPSTSTDLELYDMEFETKVNREDARYRTVTAKLFDGFNVRSLKLSGLNLERVDENAFSSFSFSNYLQALDLSRNKLKRLDSHVLANLKSLQYLNLSTNKLTFGEHNFDKNIYLRTLDISNNDIQFLSPRVFSSLHMLEHVNVARNHLRSIDACIFSNVQTSPIATTYSPVYIDLQENPIDCDCQVFYLNRHLNYRLNLTCDKPIYYKGKKFDDLNREDPSYRCEFEKIHARCRPHEKLSERDFYFLVITGSIIAFLLVLSCCCCCNNISQSGRAMRLKAALDHAKKSTTSKNTNSYAHVQSIADDHQKLIVHDK